MKSLIRVEKGTINRSLYSLVTFYDPAQQSAPWSPQKGWNGKVMWKMGASTSANRFESAANPNFKRVYASYAKFRSDYAIWRDHGYLK